MQPFRHTFRTMGCPAGICVYAASRKAAELAFRLARNEVQRLDRKYSHYREDSGLADMLRQASRPEGIAPDGETAALLNFADLQFRESGGRFDITAGRLSALWDRATGLPTPAELNRAVDCTGWQRVGWDGERLRVPPGTKLDLGGMVKEYAADRAALLLKSAGVASGYVDLGGDLHVLGPHPDGGAWRIGIRHPRAAGAMARIGMSRGGLATSGDYERCSLIGGRRYGHIIDPRSGWPVQGLASVSVAAQSCLIAGAVSTLAMLQDRHEGLNLLRSSGLAWLAHDGDFSFSGEAGMLPPCQATIAIPRKEFAA